MLLSEIIVYFLGAIIIVLLVYQYNIPKVVLHSKINQLTLEKRFFIRTASSIVSLIPYTICFLGLQILNLITRLLNPSSDNMFGHVSYIDFYFFFFISLLIILVLTFVFLALYNLINRVIILDIGKKAKLNFQIVLISIWVLSVAVAIGGDIIINISTSLVVFISLIRDTYHKKKSFSIKTYSKEKEKREESLWYRWNSNIIKSNYNYMLYSLCCISLLWVFINYRFFFTIFELDMINSSLTHFSLLVPPLLMIITCLLAAYGVVRGTNNLKLCYFVIFLFSVSLIIGFLFPSNQIIYFFLYQICHFSSVESILFTVTIQGFILSAAIAFYFIKKAAESESYSYNSLRKHETMLGVIIIGFFGVLTNLYIIFEQYVPLEGYYTKSMIKYVMSIIFVGFPEFLYLFMMYILKRDGIEWMSIKNETNNPKEAEKFLSEELSIRRNYKSTIQDNHLYLKKIGTIWLVAFSIHIILFFILVPFQYNGILSLIVDYSTFICFLLLIFVVIPPISYMGKNISLMKSRRI